MALNKLLRIVLVEDNPGDVYLLEKALESRNIRYDLTRYADGLQAVEAFQDQNALAPDLILLDLNLPHRDGFDVLKMVRQRPSLIGVPIGILTSSESTQDRHRAALLGKVRYIRKPPNLKEFIDEVGTAIEDLLGLSKKP